MRLLKNLFFVFCLALLPIVCMSNPIDKPHLALKVNSESLILDNTNIKSATLVKNEDGSYGLNIVLTSDGSKQLSRMTTVNIGKTIFLFYGDDKLISKSTIQGPLGRKFQISHFPEKEGKDLIRSLTK
jgi:preprotein translocase subunit SecD